MLFRTKDLIHINRIKIPKGYRRLRLGEIIPPNYLGYFGYYLNNNKKFNYLMTTKEISKLCYNNGWVGLRINSDGWTPFFVPKN